MSIKPAEAEGLKMTVIAIMEAGNRHLKIRII